MLSNCTLSRNCWANNQPRKRSPVKLTKFRFTTWRDQPAPPRSPAGQTQLDYWTTRISVLTSAAAQINEQQIHADSETLQKSRVRINADLQKIDAERTALLSAEEAEANAAARAARAHKKVGTFGYQVLNEIGTVVEKLVDEAGNGLPAEAVFSYEVFDHHPPLPAWAEKEKIGHF